VAVVFQSVPQAHVTIYLNGLANKTTPSNTNIPASFNTWLTGVTIGQGFLGLIDQVRLWKIARSAADIAAFTGVPLPRPLSLDLIGTTSSLYCTTTTTTITTTTTTTTSSSSFSFEANFAYSGYYTFNQRAGGTWLDLSSAGNNGNSAFTGAHEPRLVASNAPDFGKFVIIERDDVTMSDPVVMYLDAVDDNDWYFSILTELPLHGKLYQYNASRPGFRGDQITLDPTATEETMQWVTGLGDSSGAWGGFECAVMELLFLKPVNFIHLVLCRKGIFCGSCIFGPPDVSPQVYGGNVNCYTPTTPEGDGRYDNYSTYGNPLFYNEFVELHFDNPVHVTQVQIYECVGQGAVVKLAAWDGSTY